MKIILGVILSLSSWYSFAGAQELKVVDFDGRNQQIMEGISSVIDINGSIGRIELPRVVSILPGEDSIVNANYSISKVIRYSERENFGESFTSSLRKLLLYGTKAEKTEFMVSSKYAFPQRFAEIDDVRFGDALKMLANKGSELHCWEDNCRPVEVCGSKKSCERSCELLGLTCAAAGTAITQYYTGGGFPSASSAAGAAAGLGCKWACDGWVCDNIPDCHEVQKCDSHCETIQTTDGTDSVDSNTGQVIYR